MIIVPIKWVDGVSEADAAALEVAIGLDDHVTVVTVGGPAAESGLRIGLAAGAGRAIRIDAPSDLSSAAVAAALAPVCVGATWVICGDASRDRGSGSVPAFLAAELGTGQALGLVALERATATLAADSTMRAVRRLDGGRREVLTATSPTVLSVEGSVAHLRRASLPGELAAQQAPIDVRPGPDGPVDRPTAVRPYRPRPRELPMPAGNAADRIRQLTDAGATNTKRAETVVLEPSAAAAKIVQTLRTWGYIGNEPA